MREDVTRYRYGDEQHLEEALDRIFRFGKVQASIAGPGVTDVHAILRKEAKESLAAFKETVKWQSLTGISACDVLLQGGSKGVPRRFTPVLKGVREEVIDGAYALVCGVAF